MSSLHNHLARKLPLLIFAYNADICTQTRERHWHPSGSYPYKEGFTILMDLRHLVFYLDLPRSDAAYSLGTSSTLTNLLGLLGFLQTTPMDAHLRRLNVYFSKLSDTKGGL